MKVIIVSLGCINEGSQVKGVYSSLENACKAHNIKLETLGQPSKNIGGWIVDLDDEYYLVIMEFVLDA